MLKHIENSLPSLSPAESDVARWILAHPRRAATSTLATVARACGTSQPTVIRFCRHLGLNGFRDLTLRLAETLSQHPTFVHRNVRADDSATDAANKVMDSSIQTLIDQRRLLSPVDISAAAELLGRARQIAFIGLGGSGHVSEDARHKFFRLGMPCVALTDSSDIRQFAAIAGAGDVLVITSNSGQWPELKSAAAAARNRGASVIALTDPGSDLGVTADILIPCNSQDETSLYTPMNSRLSQLVVLDILQVVTALFLGEPAAERLRQTKLALGSNLSVETRAVG